MFTVCVGLVFRSKYVQFPIICSLQYSININTVEVDPHSEAAEPGGHWGQVPLHFLYLGKKCPFLGMKVPCFHRIEVPFLQNLSALFGQCPLTFEVLPRPLPPLRFTAYLHNETRELFTLAYIVFIFW